jgi:hypothetical protein
MLGDVREEPVTSAFATEDAAWGLLRRLYDAGFEARAVAVLVPQHAEPVYELGFPLRTVRWCVDRLRQGRIVVCVQPRTGYERALARQLCRRAARHLRLAYSRGRHTDRGEPAGAGAPTRAPAPSVWCDHGKEKTP